MLNKAKILLSFYFVISWTGGTEPGSSSQPAALAGPGPKSNVARIIKDLKLTLNGKSLNAKNPKLQNVLDSHLFGDTMEERAEIWPLMGQLNDMIALANNEKVERTAFKPIEDVDGLIEDDIILDMEDLLDIIEAFKKYPELMKIDYDTGTASRLTGSEQSPVWRTLLKKKSKKWKMPIKYRVKRGLSSTLVKKATAVWEKNTCIRFKKKKFSIPGPNLVFRKVKQKKCSSKVGRKPIFQYINLGPSCLHNVLDSHLFGDTMEERAEIWPLMGQLNDMIALANNEKVERTAFKPIEDVVGLIEDDIILDKEDLLDIFEAFKKYPELMKIDYDTGTASRLTGSEQSPVWRTLLKKKSKKWKMPIKYRVKRGLSSTLVKKATAVWEKNTCIRFKKKKFSIPGPNLVFRKVKQKKCSSKVGRKPIFQYINLGPSCLHVGIVVHEIGHALGFWHEQSRPDRNSYIKVIKKNIKKKKYRNFVRYPWSQSRIFGLPYDYSSIMHYGSHAFSVSSGSKQTIIPRQDDYDRTIGQRQVLSFYDAKAANFHYCESKCSGGLTWFKCKNGGYKNPNKCNECKCPDGLRGRYCTIPAKSLPNSSSCGVVTLSAKTSYKSFTSPGYSGSGYSTSNECSWYIKAPKGKRVQFQFRNSFKISCRRNCRDYVEVRYKRLSDAGPRYCCNSRPTRTFKSSTRRKNFNKAQRSKMK